MSINRTKTGDMTLFEKPQDVNPQDPTSGTDQKIVDVEVGEDDTSNHNQGLTNKAEFLSTFTAEEEKSIIRKVDWRIVSIIGLMSMIRQV